MKGGTYVRHQQITKVRKLVLNLSTLTYETGEDILMAVTKDIAKALKSLESVWEESEIKTSGSGISDGDYIAKLSNIEINTSKKGRLQVVTRFKIADGKQKGSEVARFDGIDNDISMSYFKGYCEVLGIEIPSDITDLPDTLDSFLEENRGELYALTLKTKDEYQNVYVKGASVTGEELEEQDENEEEDSDDEQEESEAEEKPTKKLKNKKK